MTARIIDGRSLAEKVKARLATQIEGLCRSHTTVRLDALLVGDDGGAAIYAQKQGSACHDLGIEHVLHELPAEAGDDDIAARVRQLNDDADVHAIMVHLPLPAGVDTEAIQSLISPEKDVEGVNPANIGNIVGKPIVVLLMRDEATVISTNKYTPELASLTQTADILISATTRTIAASVRFSISNIAIAAGTPIRRCSATASRPSSGPHRRGPVKPPRQPAPPRRTRRRRRCVAGRPGP